MLKEVTIDDKVLFNMVNGGTGEVTGEVLSSPVDRSAWNIRRKYKGLVCIAATTKMLDTFLQGLRRRQDFHYVWVCPFRPMCSSQGEPALHFHVAIAAS
ncbi:MAG TPA: hypothetical protein DCL60_03330 [Armatimonadetes bacterium]|nr:hypothetical protein [Armatimonadota bacterium]